MPSFSTGYLALTVGRAPLPPEAPPALPPCAILPPVPLIPGGGAWQTDWSGFADRAAIEAFINGAPSTNPAWYIYLGIFSALGKFKWSSTGNPNVIEWSLDDGTLLCDHHTLHAGLNGNRGTSTFYAGGVSFRWYFNDWDEQSPILADCWLRQRFQWKPGFNFSGVATNPGFNLGWLGGVSEGNDGGGLQIDGAGHLIQWARGDDGQVNVDHGPVNPFDGTWYDSVIHRWVMPGGLIAMQPYFGPLGAPAPVGTPLVRATSTPGTYYMDAENHGGFNGPLGEWWLGSIEVRPEADPFGLL